MPESPKVLPQKICENLSGLCPECLNTGSLVCNNHVKVAAVAASGGSSSGVLLGKRPFDPEFVDCRGCWDMEHAAKVPKTLPPQPKHSDASTAGFNENPVAGQYHREGQAPGELVIEPVAGVRYRDKLKKFVVEHRPSKFKWKLWVGTYADLEQGKRAIDAARFYTGQENGQFCLPDSPTIFREQGPLSRPFESISREVKDKEFNLDVKRRAKAAVRKDVQACKLAKEKQQEGVIIVTSVKDVERGLCHSPMPSIVFDCISPILTLTTTSFAASGVLSDLEDYDDLEQLEEYWDMNPLDENQEGDGAEDDGTPGVTSSLKDLVAPHDDDPFHEDVDQWFYPDFAGCCCSEEVHGLSSYYPSFELFFADHEYDPPVCDHTLRSALTCIVQSGDDLQDYYDIPLWDHNNNN